LLCGVSNTPGRVIHHPLEGLFVVGVEHQAQVGDHILDFLALVKGKPTIYPVGQVTLAQGLLKNAGLCVGTVKYDKIVEGIVGAEVHFLDPVGNDETLLDVRISAQHLDALPHVVLGIDRFVYLSFILGNQAIGCVDNGLGGTVILLQLEQAAFRIIFFEFEDVVNIGTPERIDALGIIAHHTYPVVFLGQLLDDEVLGKVGVLVFIDQNKPEAVLIGSQHLRMIPEQDVGHQQDVIEIHGGCQATPLGVTLVDFLE